MAGLHSIETEGLESEDMVTELRLIKQIADDIYIYVVFSA